MSEILCVPTKLLREVGIGEGLSVGNNHPFFVALEANHVFLPREQAEKDPTHKQIIPYVLVTCDKLLLRYMRASKDGEARLHGRRSIGVGGHIEVEDAAFNVGALRALCNGVQRELLEELGTDSTDWPPPVGFINDNSSEVGSVHLGVVYCLRLREEQNDLRVSTLSRPEWIPLATNTSELHEYEGWSVHCLSNIDLLAFQHAKLGEGRTIRVRVLRSSTTPGFYECEDDNGTKLLISRSQFCL